MGLNTGEKVGFAIALIPVIVLLGFGGMIAMTKPVYSEGHSGGTRHRKHKSNMSKKLFR
jgi:hypothetical protein